MRKVNFNTERFWILLGSGGGYNFTHISNLENIGRDSSFCGLLRLFVSIRQNIRFNEI